MSVGSNCVPGVVIWLWWSACDCGDRPNWSVLMALGVVGGAVGSLGVATESLSTTITSSCVTSDTVVEYGSDFESEEARVEVSCAPVVVGLTVEDDGIDSGSSVVKSLTIG